MKGGALAAALLLAGCAGTGGWTKPGADPAASEAAHRECRAVADSAVKTDADIDQDITATRGNDWQRAQLGRIASDTMREQTRDRAAGIVTSCMRGKGFSLAR